MSSELQRIINDLEEGLKGEHRGVMPIPIVDLKVILPALKAYAGGDRTLGFKVETDDEFERRQHNEKIRETQERQLELLKESLGLQREAVRSQVDTNEAHAAAVERSVAAQEQVAQALETIARLLGEESRRPRR